jgi:hypothetical protein
MPDAALSLTFTRRYDITLSTHPDALSGKEAVRRKGFLTD